MEGYLRLGLLLIAAAILFLILFESWLRKRRFKAAKMSVAPTHFLPEMQQHTLEQDCMMNLPITEEPMHTISSSSQPVIEPEQEIITLSIFAKPNAQFASYELVQAITATGMQYGDMNIFHYYSMTDMGRKTLFSLASATKPGDFDLDRIGEFSCVGLTLFMDVTSVPDAAQAFELMLVTAEQLAEDLDGDVYAGPRKPLTLEILEQYRLNLSARKGSLA